MERKDPGRGTGTTGGEPGRPRAARTLRSFREPDATRGAEMRDKSLAAFLVSLSFLIMSLRKGSEGARAPRPH